MANRQRDAGREKLWRRRLQRQAASGLSARAFCRREGLTEPSFYAWRRTIARRDAAGGASSAIPRRRKPSRGRAAFVPVVVTDLPPRDMGIVVELTGGRRLRLPEAMPLERVVQLLRALEAAARAEEVGA